MTEPDITLLLRRVEEMLAAQTALQADVTAIRDAFEDEAVLRIVQERRIGSLERAVARLHR